jgi:heterogeneous nuclear ribonucleoprotein A1/A3
MGKKRKKGRAAKEPRKNHHLHPHSRSRPSISTREHKRRGPAPGTGTGSGSGSGSESDTSPPSTSDAVRRLIDPYSKPRLIAILAEAATANPALRARLGAAAAASPSHRRLFVHGLPPHADGAALAEAFSRFGPLADCHAVADHRASGRCRCCKGYGFVSFASRAAARRAVREAPRVTVAGRPVSVQFASAGPDPSGGGGAGAAGRRVYVTNVAPDASAERLRAFFARFGELKGGPFGFDGDTGASRGYALFVYQAAAGAAKAVEEPYRVFEARTLHCQLANEPAAARKTKAPVAPPPAVVAASAAGTPPRLQSVLDAAAAAGVVDLASYARDPARAAALLGQNPALAAAALSAALASGDAAAIPLTPATVSLPVEVALALPNPATAVTLAPSPVMVGVRPSGGPGLLGAYKPPLLPVVAFSSGRKGTLMGT